MEERCRPGEIRDAIVGFLSERGTSASVAEIRAAVAARIKAMAPSSVRSYLRLNTGSVFERTGHGNYVLAGAAEESGPRELRLPELWLEFSWILNLLSKVNRGGPPAACALSWLVTIGQLASLDPTEHPILYINMLQPTAKGHRDSGTGNISATYSLSELDP